MTQQLYKAVWQVAAIDNGNPNQLRVLRQAFEFLNDNGLIDHYVNCYDNDDNFVIVLSDRDTALMLKLAIG